MRSFASQTDAHVAVVAVVVVVVSSSRHEASMSSSSSMPSSSSTSTTARSGAARRRRASARKSVVSRPGTPRAAADDGGDGAVRVDEEGDAPRRARASRGRRVRRVGERPGSVRAAEGDARATAAKTETLSAPLVAASAPVPVAKAKYLSDSNFAISVAVDQEITSCGDLLELAELVERRVDDMSDVNVSTAYGTLAKYMMRSTKFRLEEVIRRDWFTELEAKACEKLPTMKPRGVAQVIWACGYLRRVRKPSRDVFWDALEANVERCAKKFEPQGVSNTAWSYAKMDMRIPSGIRDALEAHIVKNAGKYKAYELSVSFWGLTRFGHRPSMQLVEIFERKMMSWFDFCKAQELSNIAASYARVKGCGTTEFLNAVAQESFSRLNEFKDGEFGMLLWGLSNAGYFITDEDAELIFNEAELRSRSLQTAEIALVAGSFATFSDVQTVGYRDNELRSFNRFKDSTRLKLSKSLCALENAFLKSMPKCNCDDLSYVIWAFAHLAHHPSADFVRAFEDQTLTRLDDCTPQNLANILYGFSTLRVQSMSLFTNASFCVMEKLDKFSSVELFMVYGALANSHYDPGPQMMLQLERTALPMIETFSPAGLTEFLRVFAKLRYMIDDDTFAAICERCSTCPEQYNSYTMSMTLWSYAQLGKQPCTGVLNRFNDELQGSTKQFQGQDFGLALWSLIVLGTLAGASKRTIAVIKSLVRLNAGVLKDSTNLTDETLCSLYMARLVAIGTTYETLVLSATENIADACKTAWLEMKTRDPTISKLQSDVSASLEELDVLFELEAPVEGGLIRPDIVLADRRVVIEVDGPHHFSYDAKGMRRVLGPTIMRNKLLESWGWHVCALPYHEWADLITAREKRAYLKKLLAECE